MLVIYIFLDLINRWKTKHIKIKNTITKILLPTTTRINNKILTE